MVVINGSIPVVTMVSMATIRLLTMVMIISGYMWSWCNIPNELDLMTELSLSC